MGNKKLLSFICICIALFSTVAAATGIFYTDGPGEFEFMSIYGNKVLIYGQGIYKYMSADVAPQCIAQDVVTLFIGVPLLLLSLYWSRQDSTRGKVLLAGTLGYFLVTYLFYLMMAMMNTLFLVYVVLLGASFFGFILSLRNIRSDEMTEYLGDSSRFPGIFLILCAVSIALLWLQVVIPPLQKGQIPIQVQHYTTLVVQGLDLAIGLPAGFVAGLLFLKGKSFGYVIAPVYLVFLSILMTALTAKVIAMGLAGANVFPVVIIIPVFNALTVISAYMLLKKIGRPQTRIIYELANNPG